MSYVKERQQLLVYDFVICIHFRWIDGYLKTRVFSGCDVQRTERGRRGGGIRQWIKLIENIEWSDTVCFFIH